MPGTLVVLKTLGNPYAKDIDPQGSVLLLALCSLSPLAFMAASMVVVVVGCVNVILKSFRGGS
jgi:hypothetical protein